MWRVDPFQILLALALDLLLGDPRGWPHIARWAGRLSAGCENLLTRWFGRCVLSGLLFWLLVNGVLLLAYAAIYFLCASIHPALGWFWQAFIIYQAIAAMDLARHARAVMSPLVVGDLPTAHLRLSWIVGRDTANLSASEMSRATIESVAESTNDAVIAPLFWSVIAGAPGALLYRTCNTLDSMVGHRTESYEKFGKVSAQIDDLLNWLPARLTAMIFCLLNRTVSWSAVRREAAIHASPNAGWSESAMAHALNVRLGGDNFYDGQRVASPVFNTAGRMATPTDIAASLGWMWRVTSVCAILLLLFSFTFHFFIHP